MGNVFSMQAAAVTDDALVARPLVRKPVDAQDKRRHFRYQLRMPAKFLLLDTREEKVGVLTDVSASGAAVETDSAPPVGTNVVLHAEPIGLIPAKVVRLTSGGFASEFQISDAKREKLATLLKWSASMITTGRNVPRAHDRIRPANVTVTVRLRSGQVETCNVRNLSRSGAAIDSTKRPPIDSLVTLGQHRARVVRHDPGGYAVEFLRLIPAEVFDENYIL
ncbi:MAG TPA: PilZ domain-containing protein [Beijerinckiaceae bacterium]|jgi:hypothetical protein